MPGSANTDSAATTAAVLTVHADGTAEIGAHPAPGSEIIRDFAGRFGDPVPMVTSSGRSYTGTELTAAALASLAARCTSDSDPTVFVSYPSELSGHAITDAGQQLRTCGLSDVHFLPDAVAAAAWAQSEGQVEPGDVAVVYDLGAAGLTVTLVRIDERPGTAGILGAPVHSEEFSGDHIDAALLRQVLNGVAAGQPQFSAQSTTPEQLRALRSACRTAKESLATETATSIPVRLDGLSTDIRLVRAELEDLIGPALQASIDLMHDAIRRAGLDDHDVNRVIAAGGGSAIPLVSEVLSREMRLPVAVADQPGATAALGALAAGLASRSEPVADLFPLDAEPWSTDPTVPVLSTRENIADAAAIDDSHLLPAPRATAATAEGSRARRWAYRGAAAAAAVAALAVGVALHSGRATAPVATAHPAAQTSTTSTSSHALTRTSPTPAARHQNSQQVAGTATPTSNYPPSANTPAAATTPAGAQPTSPTAAAPANNAPANNAPQASAPAPAPAPANTPDPGETVPPESNPQFTLPAPQLPLANTLGNAGQNLLSP